MNELKKIIESMMSGIKLDTDSMFESYRRELDDLDKRLAFAEGLLIQAMTCVKLHRGRIRDVLHPEEAMQRVAKPEPIPRIVQQGPRSDRAS